MRDEAMGLTRQPGDESTLTKREITDQERLRLALTLALPPSADPTVEPDEQPKPMIRFEDAAQEMGLSVPEVISVLKDPNFLKVVQSITKARADMLFHGPIMERLAQIAAHGDDREALTAAKLIGQINGSLKAGPQVEINLNFSDHYEKFDEARRSGRVIDLFAIKDPSRLDRDEDPEAEDG